MSLIIVDFEGTISDDRERLHYLQVDMTKYYNNILYDPINTVCKELLLDITELEKENDPLFVYVTTYPRYYQVDDKRQIDIGIKIRNWLDKNKLTITNIVAKPRKVDHSNYVEDKLRRISKIVMEHIEERQIYYLENDLNVAIRAKAKFPTAHIYHVDYDDFNLLKIDNIKK
jgi:hypothetical protein